MSILDDLAVARDVASRLTEAHPDFTHEEEEALGRVLNVIGGSLGLMEAERERLIGEIKTCTGFNCSARQGLDP